MASDSDSLTAVVVGDGEDLGCRSALVANSEGTRGVEDLKAIRKVNELQEITIDGLGENGLIDYENEYFCIRIRSSA
jgi:hypothetical protein